jgi:flagellin
LVFDFPEEFEGGNVVLDDDKMIINALNSADLGLTYDIGDDVSVYKKLSGETGSNITFFCGAKYNVEEIQKGNDLVLQIGETSREADKLHLTIERLSAKKLGIDRHNILTQNNANSALTATRVAINQVSAQRAALGAWQNRLEYTINNHETTIENISSANSRIRDTDIAETMSSYTKNNLLMQASQSMFAQANQTSQAALELMA